MEFDLSYDKKKIISYLDAFPEQCKKAIALASDYYVKDAKSITRIIVCGMGGSALCGMILRDYFKIKKVKIPVEVCKEYDLPAYADHHTLVIAVSYSGDTEETISAYKQAHKHGCKVMVLTSGGKLQKLSSINAHELILLPNLLKDGVPARVGIAYTFFPILVALHNSHVLDAKHDLDTLPKAINNPVFKEKGREFAKKIYGKTPIIYTSERLACVGYFWKIMFNETSKILSYNNTFSEMNHNEIVGYTNNLIDTIVFMIKDEEDHERILKRMEFTRKLIKDKTAVSEVFLQGNSPLSKIFSAIYLGEYVTYYLGILYKQDPALTPVIVDLKDMMKNA